MRFSLKIILIFFRIAVLLLFNLNISNAQSSEFMFRRITIRNGLPYPDVCCITRDNEGYTWIGSSNGLFRFDGLRYDIYKHNDSDSGTLGNNTIAALYDDGNQLICATSKTISVLNKTTGRFKNYTCPMRKGGDYVNVVRTIIKDIDGNFWMMASTGLIKFKIKTGKIESIYHDDKIPGTISNDTMTMPRISEDKIRNGFWFATVKGLNFYSYSEKKFYNYLYNPKNWTLFDNKHYQAVILFRNTLYYFTYLEHTIKTFDFATGLTKTLNYPDYNGKKIISIVDLTNVDHDSTGNVWFGTWQVGTVHLDLIKNKITYLKSEINNPFSILEIFTRNVYVDKYGNAWFSHGNGISVWNSGNKKMHVYFPSNNIRYDTSFQEAYTNYYMAYIYDMKEDNDTNLWIACDGLGIFKKEFSSSDFTGYLYKSDTISDNCIFSLSDNDSNLFVGSRAGLKSLDKKTGIIKNIYSITDDPAFYKRTVYRTLIDSKRRLWLSNVGTGTYVYDLKTGRKKHFEFNDKNPKALPYYFVVNFYEDRSGKIYALTPKGYSIYNETDSSFTTHTTGELIPQLSGSPDIRNMFYDRKGLLWFNTNDGFLAYVDTVTRQYKIFSESNGLNSNIINDIDEDLEGNIWIATNIGVMRWLRKENKIEKIDLDFDQSIIDYTRILISKTGKIYVSNFKAVIEIDPRLIDSGEKISNLLISRISVFDKQKMFSGNEVRLSYSENFFSINYSTPENIFYDDVEYRYKLNGFDKYWVYAGKEQTASYTNVPGGNYEFIVQARTGNQDWENTQKKLNISISNVFYQSWWFRLLAVLLVAMLLRSYLLFRENQNQLQLQKEAIAYFSNANYEGNNVEEILRDMVRNVISKLNFEDCVIYLVDSTKNVLIQKAALENKMNDDNISNPIEIPIGRGIVGTVAKTGHAEIVNNTAKDSRYIVDDNMRLSEITVPIIHDKKVIGVIDAEHSSKNYFTKKHLQQLETIASICSDKIANAIVKQQLRDNEVKLLEYDKQVAQVRLMALRSQMNPHFIFNCLNSIDNFILKQEADKASMYLNKFAKLIRLILNQSDKLNTTLQTEIEIINYYLELEAQRFGNKFTYMINETVEEDLSEIEIPSMVIQPFVENAILHGIMNREGAGGLLKIKFTEDNGNILCIIEDNGVGRKRAAEIKASRTSVHSSKAMKVTEDRLQLLQQKAQQVAGIQIIDLHDAEGNPCGTRVELRIPVIGDGIPENESEIN